MYGPAALRFAAKVSIGDGCWKWLGSLSPDGYGKFGTERIDCGRMAIGGAHRYAYTLLVGPIPDGMTLDHVCHKSDGSCQGGPTCQHRRCVNPDHLVPVPSGVNTLRSDTPAARNAAKTHCVRGHAFTPENIWRLPSAPAHHRRCVTCRNERSRLYMQRKRREASASR